MNAGGATTARQITNLLALTLPLAALIAAVVLMWPSVVSPTWANAMGIASRTRIESSRRTANTPP